MERDIAHEIPTYHAVSIVEWDTWIHMGFEATCGMLNCTIKSFWMFATAWMMLLKGVLSILQVQFGVHR